MGFLGAVSSSRSRAGDPVIPTALLELQSCTVCPLNRAKLQHPKMPAHGTNEPVVYFLGEAPGADEDAKGRPFVGKAGRTLRLRIPPEWENQIRMNNVIQCRPPDNRDPAPVEIACCRGRIVRDIEATKPVAIFGFGNVPLQWAMQQTGITKWSGRRIPVQIGNHKCWFFPMLHPSYVMRTRKFTPESTDKYGSEIEFAFAMDMKRAFREVERGLPKPVIHTPDMARADVRCITGANGKRDHDAVVSFIRRMREEHLVGLDYETNCVRPYQEDAKILTIAMSGEHETMAWAVDHREAKWDPKYKASIELEYEDFLYNAPRVRKAVHQLAFEMEWTAYKYGRHSLYAGAWGCSVVQAYTLDERMKMGKPDCLSLEFLALQRFGINVKELSGLDRARLDETPVEQVLHYNGIDARYHRHLFLAQDKDLVAQNLHATYRHLVARIPALVQMQLKGVPIDQAVVKKYFDQYMAESDKVAAQIEKLDVVERFRQQVGRPFRMGSNPDVLKLCRSIIGKPIDKADETELKKVKHAIVPLLIKWRKANKNLSTYVLPLKTGSKTVWPDGKLHATYSTTRTRTSRTSCEDPNEQNYPKRNNKQVRSQIKPKPQWRVVSFDLGQIQARNVAMESRDPALVKAFWDRYDIHTDWMLRTQKLHPTWIPDNKHLTDKQVARDYRNKAKNEFVFPSFFGAQPRSISGYLGIPEFTAKKLHDQFWQMFPNIKDWHERIIAHYKKYGYVTGLSGVRRRAPISPNELINAPIQADEALIVCDAMDRLCRKGPIQLVPNMEVHDDLTFIWKVDEIEKWAPIVIDHMVNTPLKWAHIVPIVVEMQVGTDWSNQKEVGQYASDTWKGDLGEQFFKEPMTGSWSDGDGWANSRQDENHTKNRKRGYE